MPASLDCLISVELDIFLHPFLEQGATDAMVGADALNRRDLTLIGALTVAHATAYPNNAPAVTSIVRMTRFSDPMRAHRRALIKDPARKPTMPIEVISPAPA